MADKNGIDINRRIRRGSDQREEMGRSGSFQSKIDRNSTEAMSNHCQLIRFPLQGQHCRIGFRDPGDPDDPDDPDGPDNPEIPSKLQVSIPVKLNGTSSARVELLL